MHLDAFGCINVDTFRNIGKFGRKINLLQFFVNAQMFMALASSWNLARVLDESKGHMDPTVYYDFAY